MRHVRPLPLFAGLALAACQPSADTHTARALERADLTTMIALGDALSIAQGQVPGGVPVGAVLEVTDRDEQEPPAWEVSFFVAGSNQVISVEVHAESGAVLEVEVEDDEADDAEGKHEARP